MSKESIIQKTIEALNILPTEKVEEISDFALFVLKKYEEQVLQDGIKKLQSDSRAFSFLSEDEELYSEQDIKS